MKKCLAPTAHLVGGLYREHHGWLRNWLRTKVRRAEDADDLTQDTFVRVLCAATPLHIDTSPCANRAPIWLPWPDGWWPISTVGRRWKSPI